MHKVPLPIPDLILKTITDETGFTTSEKIALRNAWTLLSPDIEEHAKQLFLAFFTEHEGLLERFRDQNGQFKMKSLHAHPYQIFYTFESMIFEGLEGLSQMHGIISPVIACHCQKNVKSDEIAIMSEAMGTYLKGVLHKVISPTLERAIDKICWIIMGHHGPQ